MNPKQVSEHFEFMIRNVFFNENGMLGHIGIYTLEADGDMPQCDPCAYIYNVDGAKIISAFSPSSVNHFV